MNSFLGNKPISRENTLNIKEMEYGQQLKFNEKTGNRVAPTKS